MIKWTCGSRSEMDITTVFETVISGSSPDESTKYLIKFYKRHPPGDKT